MVKSFKRKDGLDEMGWMGWVWNPRRGPYRYFRKYLKAPLLSAPLCGANNNDNNHDCHYNHHHDHQNRDYHDPPPVSHQRMRPEWAVLQESQTVKSKFTRRKSYENKHLHHRHHCIVLLSFIVTRWGEPELSVKFL